MILNQDHAKASKVHTFVDVAVEIDTKADTYLGSDQSRIDYIFVNQYFSDLILASTTGDTESAELGSDHMSVDVNLDWSQYITEPSYDLPTILTYDADSSILSLGFLPVIAVFISLILVRRKSKL